MLTRARDNPFAVQRVQAIGYEPRGWTWDELIGRLEEKSWRGAIVGPHGSGKTTLLESLAQRLSESGLQPVMIRLNREKRQIDASESAALARLDRHQVVLVDGSEQLSNRAWRGLDAAARLAKGLIVTAHEEARLPIVLRCEAEVAVLRWIVKRLTGEDALDGPGAARLLAAHDGNMRHALLALYDNWGSDGLQGTIGRATAEQG
jgi:hypothetical protein